MKLGPLVAGPDPLIFSAEDEGGPVEVVVSATVWEAYQAETPGWMDAADRRDYALQMIELRVVREPVVLEGSLRVVRIG